MKYIGGFSGGIDSQACALWMRRTFPAKDIILLNSNAGRNEDPLTVAFVEEYSATVFPVTVVNAIIADMWKTPGFAETRGFDGSQELTFDGMIKIKGRPPSRKAQFCTEILKLRPQKRWCVIRTSQTTTSVMLDCDAMKANTERTPLIGNGMTISIVM